MNFTELNLSNPLINALADLGGNIDHIFYCPHHPNENCQCRKPKIHLLALAQKKFNIPLEKTIIIGDSECDLLAGKAFGCDANLVLTGRGEMTLKNLEDPTQYPTHQNLAAAVDFILGIKQ